MPKTVTVLGAGKVGRLVVHLLSSTTDYTVSVADRSPQAAERVGGRVVDIGDAAALGEVLSGQDYVVSCAPFHCNAAIASAAKDHGVHYLDLTEDVATTKVVRRLSEGAPTAFIPQCGLAPGFITIVTRHLTADFDKIDGVKMRVGALPMFPHNRLKYNLTWSTAGLVNEYCHACEAIVDGELTTVPPLEGLEALSFDGMEYEAFNTSGGLGTLAESWAGKVGQLDYKSIRYPGHRDLVAFLMEDLKFRDDPSALVDIFERSIPNTDQDVVLVFVTASGWEDDRFVQRSYAKKIYNADIDGQHWGAIQITTASGLCAVLDLHAAGALPASGFIRQEDVPFARFIENRFGKNFA